MAPFGPPVTTPPVYREQTHEMPKINQLPQLPGSDNTECNYLVMFFVAGVFLLGLTRDSMKGRA